LPSRFFDGDHQRLGRSTLNNKPTRRTNTASTVTRLRCRRAHFATDPVDIFFLLIGKTTTTFADLSSTTRAPARPSPSASETIQKLIIITSLSTPESPSHSQTMIVGKKKTLHICYAAINEDDRCTIINGRTTTKPVYYSKNHPNPTPQPTINNDLQNRHNICIPCKEMLIGTHSIRPSVKNDPFAWL
jgi:hypothetical protein